MNVKLFIQIMLLCTYSCSAQVFTHAKAFAGKGYESGEVLVADKDDNLYTLGRYTDSLTLGTRSYASINNNGSFLVKTDTNGYVIWSMVFSDGYPHGKALTVDSGNNLIMTLYFSSNKPYINDSMYTFPNGYQNAMLKISSAGHILWVKSFRASGINNLASDTQGNIYATGGYFDMCKLGGMTITDAASYGSSYGSNAFTAKLDSNGSAVWLKGIGRGPTPVYNGLCYANGLALDAAGNVFINGRFGPKLYFDLGTHTDSITARTRGISSDPQSMFMAKYDNGGNLQWGKHIDGADSYGTSIKVGPDNNVYMSATSNGDVWFDNGDTLPPLYNGFAFACVVSSAGNTLHTYQLKNTGRTFATGIQILKAGEMYLYVNVNDSLNFGGQHFVNTYRDGNYLLKVDFNSVNREKWAIQYAHSGWIGGGLGHTSNGTIYFANRFEVDYQLGSLSGIAYDLQSDAFIVGIKDTLIKPRGIIIAGRVLFDSNNNCQAEPTDLPLPNHVLEVTPGPTYTSTNAAGEYTVYLPDTGAYNIHLLPQTLQAGYPSNLCPVNGIQQVHITSADSLVPNTNFYLKDPVCPHMRVEVNNQSQVFCKRATDYITVCNDGLADARNILLEVNVSPNIVTKTFSHGHTTPTPGTYIFNLNTVPALGCVTISLVDSVVCNATNNGMTTCISAKVTPHYSIIPLDTNWSGAEVSAVVKCVNSSSNTVYTIKNITAFNMVDSTSYKVYLDSALVVTDKVKIPAYDSVSYQIATNGKTVRLEVNQVPYHPTQTLAFAFCEGCGLDVPINVSKQYVTQFPLEDGNPETDIDCKVISASNAYNSKDALPTGLTANNYIKPNTRLNYKIRFQNSGTVPVLKMEIIDTLSRWLDVRTLRLASSSLPCTYFVTGSATPVIHFLFYPVSLPSSTASSLNSQGYVSFSIMPFDSTPIGTHVYNSANIYYDLSAGITTNTTHHQLLDTTINGTSAVMLCKQLPQPIAMNDTVLCGKNLIGLTAIPTTIGTSYWSIVKGAGYIADTLAHTNLLDAKPGAYQIVWNTAMCLTHYYDTVNIENYSTARPTISYLPTDSLLANGYSLSYKWYRNDTLLPDTTNKIAASIPGRYTVSGVSYICETLSSTPYVVAGITEISLATSINIYPNPSNGKFILSMQQPTKQLKIELLSIQGQILYTEQLKEQPSIRKELDYTALAKGIYLLKVSTENGVAMKRVVMD